VVNQVARRLNEEDRDLCEQCLHTSFPCVDYSMPQKREDRMASEYSAAWVDILR
jgi:hypothetical protein